MASSSNWRHKSAIGAFLGQSAPFPVSDLPTLRDVLKQCLLLQEMNVKAERNFKIHEMASEVASLILPIWHRANAKLAQPPIAIEKD